MIVQQAIYGVVRNGHGLRAASGDRRLAADLANRLDLPDTAPPGAEWSPYISGFAHQDIYVLARTFRDTAASRAGMVLTHALVAPLDKIVATNDLRPLLERLIASPDLAPAEAVPLEIETGDDVPPPSPDLSDAAAALVIRAAGPVVRVGVSEFEELATALWGRMWPALRRRFSFRLSFGPGDVVESPAPTIVCTPDSLIGRWQQHRIVGRTGNAKPLAAAVIDGSEPGVEIRTFANSIGAELATFDELPLLEQAYRMASTGDAGISRVLAAIRLVERLSPDSSRGEAEKRVLVNRIVEALPRAKPSDILPLRNLSMTGFTTAQNVWKALEAWSEKYAFPAVEDADVLIVLRDALLDGDACAEWRDAVADGLNRSACSTSGAFATGFWRWATIDPAISAPLLALAQPDGVVETRLVEAAPPKLDRKGADAILRYASKHALLLLHAVAASAGLPPIEAARLQCKIQPGTDIATMRLALRGANQNEIIDCAVEISDQRIMRMAGEEVAATPSLLAGRDLTLAANRSIWAIALDIDPAAWRGPKDPRGAFDVMLLDVIDGRPVPSGILERLSETPLADLSSFARRAELWRHVEGPLRHRLLAATADAWFEHVGEEGHDPYIERELEQRILSDPKLERLLARLADGPISVGLRVMAALPGLDDARFRRWVGAAVRKHNPLIQQSAEQLGHGIAARRRREIVDDLISLQRSGRKDLNPALRLCYDLIGIWDRWFLNLSPISDAEKWESFAQLAADLYPSGPDHESLWERAGGRAFDLSHSGSGIWRWRDAVRSIQRGKPPSIDRLIREMRRDYEANAQLRLLADDPLFSRR
ncbi:hypothetical protein CN151_29520 [Sinorhizobium meliloti]|uniref:GAP1-N1 domain-containing protein n=2 Tax=Rhizobium meliloti TaxID=382 RepID=UPI0002A5A532|nr:effector-associated domain EAD1-containing protein [Sinorhizobium meliloti]AGA08858.1 hypothetical protein C770_GR4pC0117 [Sinorhizobium meliloti GR4]RVK94569.1 hypothetical protein CN151_29520 [Sinorhizobium meliloti]RVM95286.1 hypothetical protein CN119_09850 [Sinorhizobium meliloti]RVN14273.1 hypothetical protein CN112_01100 [Sinorhizobium meliloti]